MQILFKLLLGYSGFGLVACSNPQQQTAQATAATQLRIAVVASSSSSSGQLDFIGIPQVIAEDQQFLAELRHNNIELQWQPVTTAAVATLVNESFINNKIDFAFYGNLPAVVLNASGVNTQIVVPGGIGSNVYLIVPPHSTAQGIEDLKGKKIALHRGRPWEINFAQLIESKGLSLADFDIVNLNPQAGSAALAANSVDGLFTLSDALSLEDKKLGKIIWSSLSYPADWKMRAELWGRKTYIQQHPDVTQLLADATVRAMAWVATHQQEYQLKLSQLGQPLSVIQREGHNHHSNWQQDWQPAYPIHLLQQHYQKINDYAVHTKLIHSAVAADTLLEPKFTLQALKNLTHQSREQP